MNTQYRPRRLRCREMLDIVREPTRRMAWRDDATLSHTAPIPHAGALEELMTSHAIATPPGPTAIIEPGLRQEYVRNPVRRGAVLLAVDGNELSEGPAIAAKLLAERLDVPLELVTVLEPASLYGNVNMIPSATAALVEATRRDDRIEVVEEYAARFLNMTPAPRIHVRYGSVARTIAAAAREIRASAIVVGASPHHR